MIYQHTFFRSILMLIFAFSLKAFAQGGVTTASISGFVMDASGNGLPGANVIALHKPSGVSFGTTTRIDGRYTLQNVRVGGPYSISVTFVGFEKSIAIIDYLSLGQSLSLNFKLSQQTVQTLEATVIGERDPILNSGKTGAATGISADQISKLPSINRSFQDFSKLSPLFSGTSLSAGGKNNKMNNIQLDGTQYNDLFGLGATGTPAGQANSNPISLDAIQEFQVVIAPYDVRYGGFTGGGINAITRSGTNLMNGSVYYYNRNENFVGKSPDDFRKKLNNFSEYQSGFRLGGPVIQDKLFFFVNAEITKRQEPLDNVLSSSAFESAATALKQVLIDSFKYNPGGYGPYTTQRPSKKLFLRFDYHFAENHNLTLRHNFISADDDIITRTASNSFTFDDRAYKFSNTTNSTVLQLTGTFGNNMSNEAIVGYTRIHDQRGVNSAFPSIRLITGSLSSGSSIWAGSEEYSIANLLKQDIFEITDNFSYCMDEHLFTVGTHNEFFAFSNLFTRNYYGLYTFDSLAALINKAPYQYEYRYSLTGDPKFAPKMNVRQFGFYAQDEWSGIKDLKVTLGIRFDIPTFPTTPSSNDSVIKYFGAQNLNTSKLPSGKLLFSPRIGFNYDINGDKSMLIRGGAGVFTGRVPYVWISNQYSNTGVEFADILQKNPGFFVADPYNQPKAGEKGLAKGATTEVDITDPNFKMPQLFRLNFGVDKQLPMNQVLSVDVLYSKSINDMLYKDLNLGTPIEFLPDGRPKYTVRVASYFTRLMFLTNTSKGYQFNISGQLQGELTRNLTSNIAYSYGIAKDLNSVLATQAVSQMRFSPISGYTNDPALTTSAYEIRHRIFASFTYTYEFTDNSRTSITLFYNGQSGRPFSYIYGNDANGDGFDGNDLIYIPKDVNDVIFVPGKVDTRTPAEIAAQFNAYIEHDAYLKEHRGQIAERNGAREPFRHQLDLRISHVFPESVISILGRGIEVSLDIVNLPNLLNSKWGWVKSVSSQTSTIVGYSGVDAETGKIKMTYTDKPDPYTKESLASRFQVLLGLRYSF